MWPLIKSAIRISILNILFISLAVFLVPQVKNYIKQQKNSVTSSTESPKLSVDNNVNDTVSVETETQDTPIDAQTSISDETDKKEVVADEPVDLQNTEPDFFAELPAHNNKSSCWISYNGHVYDITTYFGKHPGGDAALAMYCGADATVAFNTKDKNLLQKYLIQ